MKESVKNFIEKNILTLEEEDIVLFLYIAAVQLSREDVNILCDYLDTARIDYKEHVSAVIEELVKDNVGLQLRPKIKLSNIVNVIPQFNYRDPIEFRNAVANAIRKVYPNKVVLTNSDGIEYVMERL